VAVDDIGLVDSDNDIVNHHDEDMMTDVELWQQLESELYRRREGEDDEMEEQDHKRHGGTSTNYLTADIDACIQNIC